MGLRMTLRLAICVFFLAFFDQILGQSTTVSGYIKDQKSGEPLLFAAIQIKGTGIGAVSNEYGFYSLTVPHSAFTGESFTVECNVLGYPKTSFIIPKVDQFKQNIELLEESVELKHRPESRHWFPEW